MAYHSICCGPLFVPFISISVCKFCMQQLQHSGGPLFLWETLKRKVSEMTHNYSLCKGPKRLSLSRFPTIHSRFPLLSVRLARSGNLPDCWGARTPGHVFLWQLQIYIYIKIGPESTKTCQSEFPGGQIASSLYSVTEALLPIESECVALTCSYVEPYVGGSNILETLMKFRI